MDLPEIVHKLKEKWQRFYETAVKPASCVFCKGERVYWNGSRMRSASVKVEAEEHSEVAHLVDILCRRIKCGTAGCRKNWTLRPPGLFPRRHYQLCVVASATSEYLFDAQASQRSVAAAHACSRRTIGRWLFWASRVAKPGDLQHHLLEVSDVPVIVKTRAVVDLARKALDTVREKVLTAAAEVLSLLEALGAALGYEPPGLQSVLQVVVADRDRVTTLASPSVPEFARRRLLWPVAASAM